MKKIASKKIDIIKWLLLLPITFFLLSICAYLFINADEHLKIFFNGQTAIKIINYSILIAMPTIIGICGFFIAPRYKLISVFIMICISLIPFILSFDMDNSIRGVSNFSQIKHINFLNPLTFTIFIVLLIIYKFEK